MSFFKKLKRDIVGFEEETEEKLKQKEDEKKKLRGKKKEKKKFLFKNQTKKQRIGQRLKDN